MPARAVFCTPLKLKDLVGSPSSSGISGVGDNKPATPPKTKSKPILPTKAMPAAPPVNPPNPKVKGFIAPPEKAKAAPIKTTPAIILPTLPDPLITGIILISQLLLEKFNSSSFIHSSPQYT